MKENIYILYEHVLHFSNYHGLNLFCYFKLSDNTLVLFFL